MRICVVLVLALPLVAHAQAEVERAVIERDRQSAEVANPELRNFHTQEDAAHRPLRSGERELQRRDREAQVLHETPPAVTPAPDYRPLPLPGGPRHGVDPIPVQGAQR
jgi:hypothetical protein